MCLVDYVRIWNSKPDTFVTTRSFVGCKTCWIIVQIDCTGLAKRLSRVMNN